MTDRENIITGLNDIGGFIAGRIGVEQARNFLRTIDDAIAMLKDQEGLLGIQQTADGITFISAGTAQQGEARGLLLGKYAMHEWLEKELLYRGLLTDDIRAVFDEAKLWEGR